MTQSSVGSPPSKSASYLAPSPLRGSPLSNPPIFAPTRTPSPSYAGSRPIPERARRRASQPQSARSPTGIPPFGTLTPCSALSTSPSPPQTTSPLSRSQPLLGSYQLSLLHSRMSLAHPPHSVASSSSSGFTVRLGAIGKGKSCPAELRCPAPLEVPLQATYYDLEDPSAPSGGGSHSGAAQTPWTGSLDLEEHHFFVYARGTDWPSDERVDRLETVSGPPPMYPGYKIAPCGQLQIIVKTPVAPVKAFVLPYDVRHLPVGGKLLIRERTHVQRSSDGDRRVGPLRYAIQLQITCVEDIARSTTRFRNSSTRRTGRIVSSPSPAPTSHRDTALSDACPTDAHDDIDSSSAAKAFFVSKQIKLVFTSRAADKSEETVTERTDEVVQSSVLSSWSAGSRGRATGGFSPGSSLTRAHEWETVRLKWIARKEVEQELGRGRGGSTGSSRTSSAATAAGPDHSPSLSFTRQPIPAVDEMGSPRRQSSLLPPLSPSSGTFLAVPLPTIESRDTSPSGVGDLIEHRPRRGVSPHAQSVKTPSAQRYTRGLRRGSGSHEERALSEKLRAMAVDDEERLYDE